MSWLYIYRILSFAATIIFAIIAMVKSIHTTNITVSNFGGSLTYARLGIAEGVVTVVLLLFELLRDLSTSPVIVIVEVISLPIFGLTWMIVGGLALTEKYNIFAPEGCIFDDFPDLNGICNDMQSIALFAFITGGVLLLYSLVLLFVALVGSNRGTPIWHVSVKGNGRKAQKEEMTSSV